MPVLLLTVPSLHRFSPRCHACHGRHARHECHWVSHTSLSRLPVTLTCHARIPFLCHNLVTDHRSVTLVTRREYERTNCHAFSVVIASVTLALMCHGRVILALLFRHEASLNESLECLANAIGLLAKRARDLGG